MKTQIRFSQHNFGRDGTSGRYGLGAHMSMHMPMHVSIHMSRYGLGAQFAFDLKPLEGLVRQNGEIYRDVFNDCLERLQSERSRTPPRHICLP